MPKIKCAIFDMDGLMFNTEYIRGVMLIEVAAEFGYTVTMATRCKMLGRSRADIYDILRGDCGADFPVDAILKERTKREEAYYQEHGVPVKKGLLNLLRYLKSQHILVAVCSSTALDIVEKRLQATGVKPYIDYVVGGNMVKHSKPDPTIFLLAKDYFHLDAKDCMIFEDSKDGILAAYNAHIPVICVPDLVEHDDDIRKLTYRTVKDLDEVISVLKEDV